MASLRPSVSGGRPGPARALSKGAWIHQREYVNDRAGPRRWRPGWRGVSPLWGGQLGPLPLARQRTGTGPTAAVPLPCTCRLAVPAVTHTLTPIEGNGQ